MLCPVLDRDLERYLREVVLEAYTRNNVRSWDLRPDGVYARVLPGDEAHDAQASLAQRHTAEFTRDSYGRH